MATTIKLKNSVTTTAAPSTLVQGETAVNITDKKVWVGDASSTPVQIIGAGAPVSGTTGTFTGNTTVAGTFAANGGATLGDASGDALTINSSAVSIPNGLNFDSNTLVIDATNNRVGVGTASPVSALHVSYDASGIAPRIAGTTSGRLDLEDLAVADSSRPFQYLQSDDGSLIFGNANRSGTNTTSSVERMRITSAGNVGIGTSSPASYSANNLVVFGSGSSGITIASGASNAGNLFFADGTTGNEAFRGYIQYNHSTDVMGLGTAGDTRVLINASGNLGLGVTPSAWSGYTAAQIINSSFYGKSDNTVAGVGLNYYNNGTNDIYRVTYNASKYEQAGGQHRWFNAPSGTAGNAITFTQAMTLDASGNLGVGTTSPQARLDVRTSGSASNIFVTSDISTSALASRISLGNSTGASRFTMGMFGTAGELAYLGSEGNFPVYFQTNGTERMRIDSSGNLLVGTTSAGAKAVISQGTTGSDTLKLENTTAGPYGAYINWTAATPNNTTNYFMLCVDSTNAKLYIYSNGTVSNRTGTYNTISDQKIKQDIVDAGSQWNDIKAVRFRKYRLIDDVAANPSAPYLLGVVAQELEQTSPALIDNCKDKDTGEITKGVKTSVLLMKAAKALQEAMERIETLEAKVTALESK